MSKEELLSAKKICQEIGIKQIVIEYDELENENFVKNDKNRCFYCRNELAHYLIELSNKYGIHVIVDGTNIDDLSDYRPGIQALENNGIQSPLVETNFTKKQVRIEAQNVGLSVFDRPSNSCLASRIPWGQRVTAERLTRIELGESIIKQIINVKQLRVRDLNGIAKIELKRNEIKLLSNKEKFQQVKSKLKLIGFSSVMIDPEGYRSGKLNVMSN